MAEKGTPEGITQSDMGFRTWMAADPHAEGFSGAIMHPDRSSRQATMPERRQEAAKETGVTVFDDSQADEEITFIPRVSKYDAFDHMLSSKMLGRE